MPLKPVKMGFKIYAVCESASGYLHNMMVYSESGQNMQAISMKMMQPFLDCYHELYCDKLYTSVSLATELLERKTYICGAVTVSDPLRTSLMTLVSIQGSTPTHTRKCWNSQRPLQELCIPDRRKSSLPSCGKTPRWCTCTSSLPVTRATETKYQTSSKETSRDRERGGPQRSASEHPLKPWHIPNTWEE